MKIHNQFAVRKDAIGEAILKHIMVSIGDSWKASIKLRHEDARVKKCRKKRGCDDLSKR